MDKSKFLPSIIVSVALIISSTILFFGMNKLGDKIKDAGIYSANVKLRNDNNRALRIIIDDDSELRLQSSQNPISN
jgi:hypothetical protein